MRSKLIAFALALVALAPWAAAGTPESAATSGTAQTLTSDAAMEQWLGLGTARGGGPTPDQYCWLEYRWAATGDCTSCYLKMRMLQEERLCCQYTGCGNWAKNGKSTCGYACM